MKIDTFRQHFKPIQDPRQEVKITHPLFDVLFGTLCAVIASARGWAEIHDYLLGHHDWFLKNDLFKNDLFKNGIPVDDTVARIISTIKP